MEFRFNRYSADELRACGVEFCQAFQDRAYPQTGDWSTAIFRWFRDRCADGLCCCPSDEFPPEFIVDHCHATFPAGLSDRRDGTYWKVHLAAKAEIKLALESEWGKRNNSAHSLNMILFDASKLAALRATSKVIVFGSQRGSDQQDIVDALMTLRARWNDLSPWLWIDVPWNHSVEFPVAYGVFE